MQVGILAAVGGGVVSGYLLQDPKLAPNALLASNAILATWAVCWWAINYFPKDLVAGLVSLLPVRAVCRVRPCPLFFQLGCGRALRLFGIRTNAFKTFHSYGSPCCLLSL